MAALVLVRLEPGAEMLASEVEGPRRFCFRAPDG